MSDEILKYGENQNIQSITEYMMLLNNPPKVEDVKTNALANNSKFLQVGTIQSLLDTYYSGLWSTENFTYQVVANEIIGSLDLKVFHPTAKTWITRTGAGAVMIQTAKNQPATVDNKIKNTLSKDFPHLKAECLKNAAKSLGVVFGRNLNNDDDGINETIIDVIENKQAVEYRTDLINKAIEYLKKDTEKAANFDRYVKQFNKSSNEQLEKYIENQLNKSNNEKTV